MIDATYVLLVPRARRNALRTLLRTEDIAPVSWREKRSFGGGSEFYLNGPASLVRETHRRLTSRLAAPEGHGVRSGRGLKSRRPGSPSSR